jgi:Lrp/AsnC family transcriptional regulator, leucine-responsive regulatory protein
MIDEIDRNILDIIQRDGRESNAEIARQVGLAPSAVLERIRKLEDRGVIKGYEARLDPRQVGLGLTVFVSVRTSECGGGVEEALGTIPEVLEVHDVAGEDCYLIKVRTTDTEELGRLLRERIKLIPRVIGTRTTVVLQTFKETSSLPLDHLAEVEAVKHRAKGK